MTYNEATKILLNEFKDSVVISCMKMDDGFLFSIRPKSMDKNKLILDPFFKVTLTGHILEYSPVMDPEEFKRAMNNVIYKNKI